MIKSSAYSTGEDDDVQINCPANGCGSKALISSRHEKDIKVVDLYCICKDPHCGHTFVSTLSFSHTLSPSTNQSKTMMLDLLRNMPDDEFKALSNQRQMSFTPSSP